MRLGFLGGSFNPVHTGHIRLGLEVLENLHLDKVEFVPAARPPHKPREGMLPFALRAALLDMALSGVPGVGANRMESLRPGPSYTCDTLEELARVYPGDTLTFIMGATDLINVHLWRRGQEICSLADIAVTARDNLGARQVAQYIAAHPEMGCTPEGDGVWRSPAGKTITLVPIPRLDISASFIRERFRRGLSLHLLVPPAVERELEKSRAEILSVWL